jgi:dsRNA-specific ribonuclease
MSKEANWLEYLQNPKGLILKKFMAQILIQKYPPYDDLLSRVAASLVTEKDLTSFANLVNDLYELGYTKAVEDYKEQLTKLGITVKVKSQEKSG